MSVLLRPNAPLIAKAGADQTVAGGTLLTLDGSGSIDPEGLPLAYRWTQQYGPTLDSGHATAAQVSLTGPEPVTADEYSAVEKHLRANPHPPNGENRCQQLLQTVRDELAWRHGRRARRPKETPKATGWVLSEFVPMLICRSAGRHTRHRTRLGTAESPETHGFPTSRIAARRSVLR
ncbi:MAG: PKD domain-containing protein [Gammaproteobacteria bacterium]